MRTIGKTFEKKNKKPTKKEIVERLKEKGITFDERAGVEELLKLIPEE